MVFQTTDSHDTEVRSQRDTHHDKKQKRSAKKSPACENNVSHTQFISIQLVTDSCSKYFTI